MKTNIQTYMRAGYAGLFLLSPEERRVEAELAAAAQALECAVHAWSPVQGLVEVASGACLDCPDPLDVLEQVEELPPKSVVLLRDFHLFLDDASPVLVRKVKETLAHCRAHAKTLVLSGCRQNLPPELIREITVIDGALPGKEALGEVLEGICSSSGQPVPQAEERDRLLDAAGGLTTMEAENAFALSVTETGTLSPAVVIREKASILKQSGLLEMMPVKETLSDIGGLEILKGWLLQRREAFSARARDYGLPAPKGLLVTGIPGTGKSLTAKVTASVFGLPLLRLDMGKLFGGLVGQSEGNLRAAIQTAEAMAPCVLMVDELEKGLSGSQSSGNSDGGTSARVFGGFLSWMQEKTAPVFVVATANDVTRLPPELLRKGRFDNLFFVDLPNAQERRAIWEIQIRRYGRQPGNFDLDRLAEVSCGMTGSEIEQAFIEALYQSFGKNSEPDSNVVESVVTAGIPLSKTMAEQIGALRDWAKTRAQSATAQATTIGKQKPHRHIIAPVGRN